MSSICVVGAAAYVATQCCVHVVFMWFHAHKIVFMWAERACSAHMRDSAVVLLHERCAVSCLLVVAVMFFASHCPAPHFHAGTATGAMQTMCHPSQLLQQAPAASKTMCVHQQATMPARTPTTLRCVLLPAARMQMMTQKENLSTTAMAAATRGAAARAAPAAVPAAAPAATQLLALARLQ